MMVDYESRTEQRKDVLVFIFDFGIVKQHGFGGLKVDNKEIIDFGFFEMGEALKLVGPERSKRIELCYRAHHESDFYFLNNHEPFPDSG